MSNYGQQPPYGQNPYGSQPNPYGQQPYGRPGQPPYGGQGGWAQQPQPQQPQPGPYGQPGQQQPQPYGQQNPWVAQQPQQPGPGRKPQIAKRSIPVVTMDAVPGREIAEVVGDVVGVVARARELPPELRGSQPLDGYVAMLTSSRQEAVGRLVEMAEAAGATAVVGLRLDCSEITQSLSEVAAYGTAVKLVPEQPDGDAATEEEGDTEPTAAQQWPPAAQWPAQG